MKESLYGLAKYLFERGRGQSGQRAAFVARLYVVELKYGDALAYRVAQKRHVLAHRLGERARRGEPQRMNARRPRVPLVETREP